MGSLNVEFGGGLAPWDGWINVDPLHGEGQWRIALGYDPVPLPDESVDRARASHCLEHIPAGKPRIRAMNEVWRILKSGAEFEVIVPRFPSVRAISEPTHVSFWVPESFDHFTQRIGNMDAGIRLWERSDNAAAYLTADEIRVFLRKP